MRSGFRAPHRRARPLTCPAKSRWNTVTQVAVLNSDPGPSGQANGVLAVYAGETQTLYREDVVFRTNASVSLNAFIFSSAPFSLSLSLLYGLSAVC